MSKCHGASPESHAVPVFGAPEGRLSGIEPKAATRDIARVCVCHYPCSPMSLDGGGIATGGGVRFLGQRRAYWRLLIRGAALLMCTLGIYRFWLATDVRRFLWSNTEIAGEPLEYTGTAFELLLGFLIAIAI